VRAIYDVVCLYTDNETSVEALRLKRNTTRFELFNRLSNNRIGDLIDSYTFEEGRVELKIRQGDIEPVFNCHGYCFADSKYWINDNQVRRLLQGDGYLESKDDTDVAVVVFSQEGTVKHTAKRHRRDGGFIYVSKAGVRGLQCTRKLEEAARGLQYNGIKIYNRETG
jgi:hypothetical protein